MRRDLYWIEKGELMCSFLYIGFFLQCLLSHNAPKVGLCRLRSSIGHSKNGRHLPLHINSLPIEMASMTRPYAFIGLLLLLQQRDAFTARREPISQSTRLPSESVTRAPMLQGMNGWGSNASRARWVRSGQGQISNDKIPRASSADDQHVHGPPVRASFPTLW